METSEVKAHLGKAQIAKLKALGSGIQVGKVLGRRLLVKLVVPFTDMDRVEKAGLLCLPKSVKDANTPLPSTGVVIQLGEGFKPQFRDIVSEVPCPIEEGSMVMFSRFAGTDFIIEEEQFRVLEEREVICTLIDTEGVVVPIAEE